jgi:hypothetical protein
MVSEHRIQDREELPHGGDDRDFARTARGHEAVKERPDHGIVLDRRRRSRELDRLRSGGVTQGRNARERGDLEQDQERVRVIC